MKRSFKGILSVCVAVAAFFAVSVSADIQTTDQTKAREGNVLVEVPGTFYNKGNEKILYRLNLIRYTACREGEPEVNADNTGSTGRKLSLAADWGASPTADQLKNKNGDYVPLQWSAELEKIAEIRSAESLLSLSLTRPNSYYEGAISMTVNGYGFFSGETVVWNMDKGFNEAIDTILLERTAWASQNSALTTGHYTYLIGMNRTYAGMSCFRCEKDADGKAVSYKYGGTNCKWGATALVLSETPKAGSKFPLNRDRLYFSTNLSSYKMTTTPRALTGDHTQLVEVATDHVKGFKINGSDRIPNDGKTVAKIRSFIDSSKFFYTFLAYSPFVFTKNRTNRKLMGALMAYIGHGAQTLSTPTHRKKLSNIVWMPQFIRWLNANPPALFLLGLTLKVK